MACSAPMRFSVSSRLTANMHWPFTDTGVPFSKPMVTSPGVLGASFGLRVSIQTSSGAELAGSSSAPPSCEMCQMLRSRL